MMVMEAVTSILKSARIAAVVSMFVQKTLCEDHEIHPKA